MYLYLINRPPNEESVVAELECRTFTGVTTVKKYVLSDVYSDIRNSAYLDMCINVLFFEDSIDKLYNSIKGMNYNKDRFRVRFINVDTHVSFDMRRDIERRISDIFPEAPDLKNPVEEFVVTEIRGRWLFGRIEGKSENRWRIYNKKPHTFCNALPSRISRALVNIACKDRDHVRLLDPCCGVGTVLLEALDMGIEVHGYDINDNVVQIANKNLMYFNFEPLVKCMDAAHIAGSYDVSIVDLPYGILSKKGSDKYYEIIGNIRKVCNYSIILSARDISDIITDSGFRVVESCIVHKGGLDRHITMCE